MFLNPKPCTAIFVQYENSTLLLRRSLEPKLGLLDLPGGFVDIDDESFEAGAIRELKEEIGLVLDEKQLQYIDSGMYRRHEYQNVLMSNLVCYFSISITKEQSREIILDCENSEFLWIALDDIKNNKLAFDCYWPMVEKLLSGL